ncbi:MAG: cobalt ECF transporter T component CbiQ [Desulfobacteraceae bacterium]|nr:cobalt ECF transporter T component CbiQ [Desulfobacteraceae bacterium]
METSTNLIIEIPSYVPLLTAAFLISAASVWVMVMRRAFGRERQRNFGSDLLLLSAGGGNGPLPSGWSLPARIVCTLAFIFITACLQNIYLCCAALLLSLLGVTVSGASFGNGLRRLGAMAGFLAMLIVFLPLSVPVRTGDTLLVAAGFAGFALNARGLRMAAVICAKATAIAFAVEMMMGREPISVFLQAVESLGMPQPVCRMIALAHRYMFVLGDESRRMVRGMHVRGFRGGGFANTARAVGNLLGMLFVRSIERTERVHEAMLSRGFTGKTPRTVRFATGAGDWAKGALLIAPVLVLLMLDRFFLG